MARCIKVYWMRKAIAKRGVFRDHWWGVPSDYGIASVDDWPVECVEKYSLSYFGFVGVSPSQFNRLRDSLTKFDQAGVTGDIPPLFFLTDGERFLAIDTQGFDYPRYKSLLSDSDLVLVRQRFDFLR